MVFLLSVVTSPVEARLDFGDLMVQRLVKAVEAHEEQEEAGEGGVDKDRPGSLRKPPTLPGLNARMQLGHGREQVRNGEPRIANGRSQVGRGKGAQRQLRRLAMLRHSSGE